MIGLDATTLIAYEGEGHPLHNAVRNVIFRIATANPSDFECFGVFAFEPWARFP